MLSCTSNHQQHVPNCLKLSPGHSFLSCNLRPGVNMRLAFNQERRLNESDILTKGGEDWRRNLMRQFFNSTWVITSESEQSHVTICTKLLYRLQLLERNYCTYMYPCKKSLEIYKVCCFYCLCKLCEATPPYLAFIILTYTEKSLSYVNKQIK